jgi:O-antigen/teichoic acid export membrane protein
MVLSGILTYAFFVLAARQLGAEAFGQIALLWGVMFVAAVMLFRPLEQTISRETAARIAREQEVRTVSRTTLLVSLALIGVIVFAAIPLWGTITDHMFAGDRTLTAMLVAGTVAYGASYVVRGMLGGIRWFGGYSLALVVDAVARLLIAAPLLWGASQGVAAAGIVGAGIASTAIPVLVGRRRLTAAMRPGATADPFRLGSALAFAAPATLIAAADQLIVNGSPLLVTIDGGHGASAAAGVVFAATILVRAPVYVFQGVAASLLPNLTHLREGDERAQFGDALRRATAVLAGCAAVITAATFALGPAAMDVLYGNEYATGRRNLTLLGLGVGLYLLSSTYSQALLALDRGSRAALSWAVSAIVFVAGFFLLPGSPLSRVAVAFAAAAIVGAGLLAAMLAPWLRRHHR